MGRETIFRNGRETSRLPGSLVLYYLSPWPLFLPSPFPPPFPPARPSVHPASRRALYFARYSCSLRFSLLLLLFLPTRVAHVLFTSRRASCRTKESKARPTVRQDGNGHRRVEYHEIDDPAVSSHDPVAPVHPAPAFLASGWRFFREIPFCPRSQSPPSLPSDPQRPSSRLRENPIAGISLRDTKH